MTDKLIIGNMGQGSFYIMNNGEFAAIDPVGKEENYLDLVKNNNAVLKYVFYTSFDRKKEIHRELLQDSVKIIGGPESVSTHRIYVARDEEEFLLGDRIIKVMYTPGPAINSCSILICDEKKKPLHLFTGRFLSEEKSLIKKNLAGAFFDALRMKIMILPDDVIVSQFTGKQQTLGLIKEKSIYLNHRLSREKFISFLAKNKILRPENDPGIKTTVKKVHSSLNDIRMGMDALEPAVFRKTAIETGALILDTRSADEYMKMHIPGTLYIGLDESFASLAGALLPDPYARILFITDEGREKDVIIRLSRMGFDFSIGYLAGGVEAWKKAGLPVESFPGISPEEFAELRNEEPLNVVDVRKRSEYEPGHLIDAVHLPLEELQENTAKIPLRDPVYIYCVSGYRSVIACSILQLMGRKNVINVSNGFEAVCSSGLRKELIKKSPISNF